MRHPAITGLHPVHAESATAYPPWLGPAGTDTDYPSYVEAHTRSRPLLMACAVWGIVLACYFILLAPARAAALPDRTSAFSPVVCYELVQDAGRMIAWARWEGGLSLEQTRSAPFPPNTPPW